MDLPPAPNAYKRPWFPAEIISHCSFAGKDIHAAILAI
jgi:hypothetical protein